MKNDIVNGIESVEIATINPGTGAVNNDWVRIENIEDGSVTLTSTADTKTSIVPEDKDLPIIVLFTPGDPDTYNFAMLEISAENLARFFNIIYDASVSLVTVLAKKKYANLAIRFTSREQFGVKKIFTFKNTTSEATYKNNITKNGLLAISVAASIYSWKTDDGLDAAYTVQKVLPDGTPVNSTPEPGTFDTTLTFTTSTTDEAEGVTGTVPATDAQLAFAFNKIIAPSGGPANMVLKISTATVASIDYPTDYNGAAFKFTYTAGVDHTGTFAAGDVTLT